MSSLNEQQKQLIFDYCIGIADEKSKDQAESIITESKEAALLHNNISNSLRPLESLDEEKCPKDLVQSMRC